MTMAEYIEKNKAIKELYEVYDYEFPTASGGFDEYARMIVPNTIKNMPAADVAQVVHGRWISKNHHGYEWVFVCSNCDYIDGYPFNDRSNYCPNCGAKMDKPVKENKL